MHRRAVEDLLRGSGQGFPLPGDSEGQTSSPAPLLPVEPLLPQEPLVNLRPCSRALRGQSQGMGARPLGRHSSQGSMALPFLGWEEPRVGASMVNKR